MAGSTSGAPDRVGALPEPRPEPVAEQLLRRRWRVLRAALPRNHGLDPLPAWVRTPEQFVGWLFGRLSPAGRQLYFAELEAIAKQTCDLSLFRLARAYRGRR